MPPQDPVLPVADLCLLSRLAVQIGGSQDCHHVRLRMDPKGGLHKESGILHGQKFKYCLYLCGLFACSLSLFTPKSDVINYQGGI